MEPAGFFCGDISLCTDDFPLARMDAVRIFMEKEALWTRVIEIKFGQCKETSLEEYFLNG